MWFILLLLVSEVSITHGSCVGSDCNPRSSNKHLKREQDSRLPLWTRGYPRPIVELEPPRDKAVIKGTTILLKCIAKSPNPYEVQRILWKKDGKFIDLPMSKNHLSPITTRSLNDNITEFTQVLYVADVEDDDQGGYKCLANNTYGTSSSKKYRLFVQTAPTFSRTPSNVVIEAGKTAKLECAAIGHPNPEISWTKDGGFDFPAATERRMHVMPEENSFYIVNVNIEDIGVYSCRAKNSAAEVVVNASLMVVQYPQFVRPMSNSEVTVGETARLECIASASPKPTLTWSKNGKPLIMTDRHFLTADSQLLIIVKTIEDDSGNYSCQISNPLGSVQQSVKLTVVKFNHSRYTLPFSIDWLLVLTFLMIMVCILVAGFLIYLCITTPLSSVESTKTKTDKKKCTKEEDFVPGQTDLSGMTPDVAFDVHSIHSEVIER